MQTDIAEPPPKLLKLAIYLLRALSDKDYENLARSYQPRLVGIVKTLCGKEIDVEPYQWVWEFIATHRVPYRSQPFDEVIVFMRTAVQQVRRGGDPHPDGIALCVLNAAMHYYRYSNDSILNFMQEKVEDLPDR